jgi:indolepyruvate ferredoxin oxidoreductase
VKFLTDYQNAAYADRYRGLVGRVRLAEGGRIPGAEKLSEAVARYLFKLMAYKDEYEVARLYTDGSFAKQIAASFDGDLKLEFHLAPPLLAKHDPVTGRPRKMNFGPWMMKAFDGLARFKFLRGTPFDPFGYSGERRIERKLIEDYRSTVEELVKSLTADNHALAVEIASIPEKIRGFGPVKEKHLAAAKAEEAALLARFRAGETGASAVAAAAE